MNTEEPAAVWADADSLVPWDKNPRKNAAAIAEVAESIKRFGFASPIIARTADRMVIAGHTRLAAAKSLGIEKVPVRFVDLDPADARLLALVDNKLGELAKWDDEKLAVLLEDLNSPWLERIGFDVGEDVEGALSDFDDLGDVGAVEYRVVVACTDEHDQAELLSELESRGLKCQALMS